LYTVYWVLFILQSRGPRRSRVHACAHFRSTLVVCAQNACRVARFVIRSNARKKVGTLAMCTHRGLRASSRSRVEDEIYTTQTLGGGDPRGDPCGHTDAGAVWNGGLQVRRSVGLRESLRDLRLLLGAVSCVNLEVPVTFHSTGHFASLLDAVP